MSRTSESPVSLPDQLPRKHGPIYWGFMVLLSFIGMVALQVFMHSAYDYTHSVRPFNVSEPGVEPTLFRCPEEADVWVQFVSGTATSGLDPSVIPARADNLLDEWRKRGGDCADDTD